MSEPAAGERAICSAKGCSNDAMVDLRWNNPKIHPAERRKSWVACADHDEHLAQFLGARGFLRERELLTRADDPSS